VLDAIDQLQIAADKIYTRRVFFMNKDGDGMSIQMMYQHNAAAAELQISNTSDVVYLMYALITCQSWWEVSIFVHQDIQLNFCVSARHVYMYLYQQHARVSVCVCVCACVCTQECFRFLTERGKWWKVVAFLSTALCSLCSRTGPSAPDPAAAEIQLEVCICSAKIGT